MYQLNSHFKGTAYRIATNWLPFLTPDPRKPIKYAEVGAFYGANIVSVAETYGAHPDSTLSAIDPWTDYADYPEYKGPANGMPYALRKPNARSEKISKTRGNPILLTLPTGQVLHYDSIKLACRSHSLHPGHLREVAQGKRKQHKGFTAQFINPL
jgi:hypothetical protein